MSMGLKLTLALALLGAVVGAQQPPPVNTESSAQNVATTKAEEAIVPAAGNKGSLTKSGPKNSPVFNSSKDKLSYALGVDLAAGLKWQKIDVDLELIVKGLRDAFASDETKLLIPPKEVAATIKQFQEERKRGYDHAMQMLSDKNRKAGADFVAENARKEGVVTLPSGLQYKILKQGEGKRPTLEDLVACHYRGTLLDGAEFDSSYKRGKPTTFPVKGVIKAWREALQLMPTGSKWKLFVPPQLAYGDHGAGGSIGPNATLIFEVELLSIEDKSEGSDKPKNVEAKPGSSP